MTREIIEELYADVVRAGVADGAFDVEDPDEAALLMRVLIDGTFLQWLQRPDWESSHGEFRFRCQAQLERVLGVRG